MRGAEDTTPNSALHTAVTPEEQRTQLEKVFRSEVFRQAPGLQKFLEYITSKAIEGLSHEIKESTIGIEVFGRTPDYDPKTDTVVRVQAHRLTGIRPRTSRAPAVRCGARASTVSTVFP